MIYIYYCEKCKKSEELNFPAFQPGENVKCKTCKTKMYRGFQEQKTAIINKMK